MAGPAWGNDFSTTFVPSHSFEYTWPRIAMKGLVETLWNTVQELEVPGQDRSHLFRLPKTRCLYCQLFFFPATKLTMTLDIVV